jgi:hypothetical protein
MSAQLLSFLDPKPRDFEFEIRPSDYTGDGSRFLKLAFDGIGEIDFLVGHAMTGTPTTKQTVEGEQVDLEIVAEIIVKKIHYRGANIDVRNSKRYHRGTRRPVSRPVAGVTERAPPRRS